MTTATRIPAAPGHWLNRERLHLYPWVLVAFYLFMMVLVFKPVRDGSAADGTFIGQGMDFGAFWTASQFTLQGSPERAFDLDAMFSAQQVINPLVKSANQWSYPPAFLLLCLPLALLPYLLSYLLFIGTTFGAYAALLRRIAPPGTGLVLLLGFPGVFQNLVHGQNGFLTAALMGAGLLWLPTRPILAGVAFGVLTIKPHLGLLIPLGLICARQWRCIASAAVTALLLYGISLLVLGPEVFAAFVERFRLASQWLASGLVPFRKNPSFFSFAMLLGQPVQVAYALQAIVAATVAGLLVRVWLRGARHALRSAALMTGALLMTPYLLEYDLAWLAFPIAWFAADGIRHGWQRGEREWLALAWLIPLGVGWLYDLIHVQLAPFVILGLFLLIVRRALRSGEAGSMAAAPGSGQ